METQFAWREKYNIGVDIIDREHQRLFQIINRLFVLREEERNNQRASQEGIRFFKEHAVKHFADEETYMESIGCEGIEQHKHIHRDFRENILPALEEELERTNYSTDAVDHFLGVCAGWLIGHTLTEDLAITEDHISKWENLLPAEETAAIKEIIVKLVFDMFRLESQLISNAYSGEKFGNGVYYRLVYSTAEDEKKQEVILVFEEKLLINTVGKAMGFPSNKLDSMLVNATRYTARQFVGRVIEYFEEPYELKEENLLSYEQFQNIFEREKPQISLLFNTTGAGYFSYCMISSQSCQSCAGTPIGHENAMAEVEKYLMKRETEEAFNQKRNVLVVDDSPTARHSIKKLLDEDYEVALVNSGVAAIRAITLNRPDLILLDYEMPVCDGKQTLEMLRSEAEFADIPIIFLTGKGDPALAKAILSLKPAGYLLKHLKPEEIKSKIDAFFEKDG